MHFLMLNNFNHLIDKASSPLRPRHSFRSVFGLDAVLRSSLMSKVCFPHMFSLMLNVQQRDYFMLYSAHTRFGLILDACGSYGHDSVYS